MIKEFIKENFDKCVRVNKEDDGTLIGMPYPYTVPCVSKHFQEMYYWDTYFTNIGLLLCGRQQQAKNNADDMMYMINRFGFMPNGNRTFYLKSSQPPYLSLMVRDLYEAGCDKEWLGCAVKTLEKEHEFWTSKRMTPIVLNRYGCNFDMPGCDGVENEIAARIGLEPPIDDIMKKKEHFVATAESGWDMNPRWQFEAFNYSQVDLNSLLYAMEKNIAFFKKELSEDPSEWEEKAQKRVELMNKYFWASGKGLFLDYNFVREEHTPVVSAACFYPLFVGLADKQQAAVSVKNLLSQLEAEHGILSCGKHNVPGTYQWDAPQGWAPMQFLAIKGLLNYGYEQDALRIAEKYVGVVEKNYELTGRLWEKYNVEEGSINTNQEREGNDELPAMLGWSAGVYLYALKLLGKM